MMKNNNHFKIMIFLADMVFLMSDFDDTVGYFSRDRAYHCLQAGLPLEEIFKQEIIKAHPIKKIMPSTDVMPLTRVHSSGV